MGQLLDGQWISQNYDTESSQGEFVRSESQFRNWITADGSPGPSGEGGFEAEAGRYHLYVSLACPWAHRALVFRALKGLESMIGVSIVSPKMSYSGWIFDTEASSRDPLFKPGYLYQIYQRAQPDYTGRVTVPVLWDMKQQTIVNNESAEIVRMLNSAFDHLGAKTGDYYPEPLRPEIDRLNQQIYDTVNNGVYRVGFTTSQIAYKQAVRPLFDTLDQLDQRLSHQRYLLGNQITEADWRLFTTLIRFDVAYYGYFKCNLKRIEDYPHLSSWLRELYQWPGIAETVDMAQIKKHYYRSHSDILRTGAVPRGPKLDLNRPHGRGHLTGTSNH